MHYRRLPCFDHIRFSNAHASQRQSARVNLLPLFWLAAGVTVGWGGMGCSFPMLAQTVVPDQSLSTPSTVRLQGKEWEVTNGTTRGNHLFHSFEQFSIPTGNSVYFNQDTVIENIFSRVTGGTASEIDGLIRANGAANLFLLNPNGILFGPNARLDIGGSFVATTADRLDFGNGLTFGASALDAPPLLTINTPIGVQFGAIAAPIQVHGSEFIGTADEALVLLGGELILSGTSLTSPSGLIELAGLEANQQIDFDLETFALDYSTVNLFQNIDLNQQTALDVSGNGGGNVRLQGRDISINGSTIESINTGQRDSGSIALHASDSFSLAGDNAFIMTDVAEAGRGSDIFIEAPIVVMTDKARISALTNGGVSIDTIFAVDPSSGGDATIIPIVSAQGNGGNITINAQDILLDGGEWDFLFDDSIEIAREIYAGFNIIAASSFGPGTGGRLELNANTIKIQAGDVVAHTWGRGANQADSLGIQINASTLDVTGGSQISALTFGGGDAGNVTLLVDESIDITGTGVVDGITRFFSGIYAITQRGGGDGGDLILRTSALRVRDGGEISASTLTSGNAGNIDIKADTIEVADRVILDNGVSSGLSVNVETDAVGSGGTLRIKANSIRVVDGGLIAVETLGEGNAGEINIRASTLYLSGVSDEGEPSTITAAADNRRDNFDAGELTINAGRIEIREGAEITVSNAAGGNAGMITLTTDELLLDDGGLTTAENFTGNGGNIFVRESDSIRLMGESQITTSALLGATGGNIGIDTNFLWLDDESVISSNSIGGGGGDILINSADVILLTDLSSITTDVSAIPSAEDVESRPDRRLEAVLAPPAVEQRGGDITLNTDILLLDESSRIAADSALGNGGVITINADSLFTEVDRAELITADGAPNFSDGEVRNNVLEEINPLQGVAELPTNFTGGSISQGCDPSDQFAVIGRGGIPLSPDAPLLPDASLARVNGVPALAVAKQTVIEVDGWSRDESSGTVRLAASPSTTEATAAMEVSQWIKTGIGLRQKGQYGRSLATFRHALHALSDYPEPSLQAIALMETGLSTWLSGDSEDAIALLNQSLAIAETHKLEDLLGDIYLSLGHIAHSQETYDIAHQYYQQAVDTAGDDLALVRALLGQLGGAIATQNILPAQSLTTAIPSVLRRLAPSSPSLDAQLHFARALLHAQQQGMPLAEPTAIENIFQVSLRKAQAMGNAPSLTYGLGSLGHLYEQQGQWDSAQILTERALLVAQDMSAPELVYQWHWQLGRILTAQWQASGGRSPQLKTAALSAYENAVQSLQLLRSDLIAVNSDVQFDFRDQVEPVYREYTKLLVEPDASNAVPQAQLFKARQVIEALQLAEVDNFLGDSCLIAQPKSIDEIDAEAAVVYPIILSDRITTIVAVPGQPIQHHTVLIDEAELTRTIVDTIQFLSPAYGATDHLVPAQTLYDWMLRPAVESDVLSNTETLTFVLDGHLRSLPMSVLHDGDRYLIEDYNIALSSGLQLLDPQPLEQAQLSGVAAGLSEARDRFVPLPAVEQELANVTQYIDATLLANEDFTKANITESVARRSPNILHLATHGQFGSSFEDTFLLTWDGRLNANELNTLLQHPEGDRTSPIELLILSACQTASGDSRAVLGLAGLALRSGARSTVATLWNVNDQSTAILMDEFYRQLQQPGITKAKALRNAQLALMETEQYWAPFYWAPFLLIGNWL